VDRQREPEATPDAEPKKPAKAKLDAKGRPVVEPAQKHGERADGARPVRVLARLGVFALLVLTGHGCDVAPRAEKPSPELVEAVAAAKAAAEDAKASADRSAKAADDSLEALRGCTSAMEATTDLVEVMRKGSRFGSAHGGI
jgi:hypothetical protein